MTVRVVLVLLFGFVLIYLPVRLFSTVRWPMTTGIVQVSGIAIATGGAAIALSAVFNFAFIGKGTPAPFAAPHHLVTRGPHRFVRNPMYIGVGFFLPALRFFSSRFRFSHT